jgi:hypothetical protein
LRDQSGQTVLRKQKEVKRVSKKVFFFAIVIVALLGMCATALATDPANKNPFTFIEQNPGVPAGSEYNSNIPSEGQWGVDYGWGSSYWTYNDAFDGLRKSEGSYRVFDDEVGQLYTVNPHGDYDTTSNDCATCHAVHRATGAFYLTRVDSPDDACSYCHIGDHRHATLQAYSNGDGTIYPRNGHTIGSGTTIPDSSVYQWMDSASTLVAKGDELAGDNVDESIQVRAYDENKNKVFKWSINYEGDFVRSGPTFLTCMSCHQPHNAEELIWKPTGYANGYKLLRANPSGSVADQIAMQNYEGLVLPSVTDLALKAVETELSASTTGWALTGYTQWRGSGANAVIPVTPGLLSVWCANCHNLNIGAAMEVETAWRGKSHVDRTHPVPLVTPDTIDCADCHGAQSADFADFPHSGSSASTKLLGADYDVTTGTVDAWDPNANKHLDMICLRCHDTGIAY